MKHITDTLREQIATQNRQAARKAALILKCEWEAWKGRNFAHGLSQQIRGEHGHA